MTFMVMERGWVSVVEPSSTWAVKLEVPTVVGVPEMIPVPESSDSPSG